MNENIEYISKNFIELNELSSVAEISIQEINTLIANERIPNYSYQIESISTITSPLGDSIEIKETKKYFDKSVVDLLKNIAMQSKNEFKQQCKEEFFAQMNKNEHSLDDLAEIFEQKWQFYIKGVYGICLLEPSFTNIAKKATLMPKMITFLEENEKVQVIDENQEQVRQFNHLYNEFGKLFAPYQRATSTRGKYLDTLLRKCNLDNLIK